MASGPRGPLLDSEILGQLDGRYGLGLRQQQAGGDEPLVAYDAAKRRD